MNTQYLTCQFKIHNPSARKRQVMDYALEQYTLGYTELLEYAHDNLSVLEREGIYEKTGKYTGMSIAPCLPRSSHKIHSSAKDSLRQNVAANLASYFELIKKDESPSLPTSRDPSPEADLEALDYFILVGSDLEDYKESKRRYLKRSKSSVMPIFFCRSDGAAQNKSGDARNRNFSLLINSRRDKLFAVMWLLPAGHELCKSIGINSQDGNHLIKLDTGEIFSSNSSTAILIPLELGRNGWQYEKFIEASINGKARPKTAFLLKNAQDYYFHVAFEFQCKEKYKPQTYLGVDRGVFFTMAYAIVDANGKILLMDHNCDGFRDECIQAGKRVQEKQQAGRKVTMKDYRRKERDAILHRLANELIETAKDYRAMIVLEDLNIRIRGKFYKSAWEKLYNYIGYKCRLEGVPFWHDGIWAAYSSQFCIYCGEINRSRKRDGSPFECPTCDASYHSDEGAAVNIARRALYRKKDWEGKGGYRAWHKYIAKASTFTTK